MKTLTSVAAILLLGLATVYGAATNDPATALQKGLFEEEANHNLGAAIQLYQTVIARFDRDRKLAGTAVFRLGECYRKQGNTNEAVGQYQRVLSEFADQDPLTGPSRQNLIALGATPTSAGTQPATSLSSTAREEQKKLLQQEIKLVEQQLATEQKRVEMGVVAQESLIPTQRELLGLKRQFAALEAAEPKMIDLLSGAVSPPTSVEAEEVKRIQAMIKDSPDLINAPDTSTQTPLIKAALNGQLIVAGFLVRAGADLEGKDGSGCTALYWAAYNGHKALVELLLANNAQTDDPTKEGKTALHGAAERGFRSVVEVLLAHGAKINALTSNKVTPLHFAVVNGFRSVAELLLDKGADVNLSAGNIFTGRANYSGPALQIAAARGDLPLVEMLLSRKANIEQEGDGGMTSLQTAAYSGHLEVARSLLAHGAVVDARNQSQQNKDWTALHYSVLAGDKQMVDLLLKSKANSDARIETGFNANTYGSPTFGRTAPPATGYTALLLATAKCNPGIVQLLLDAKADPNAKSATGDTPVINTMTLCSQPERGAALALLLEHGASPEAADPEGNAAIILAAIRRDKDSVQLLLQHHANPSARNLSGLSALNYLAFDMNGPGPYDLHVAIAQALVAAKVDVNAPNPADGKTPLKYLTDLLARTRQTTADESIRKFADLLRTAGAVEDLPQLDRIEVARTSSNYRDVVFWRATNDYNNFSLFELTAVAYGQLVAPPRSRSAANALPRRLGSPGPLPMGVPAAGLAPVGPSSGVLPFPDFSKVVIRRATPDGRARTDIAIPLQNVFEKGKCDGDVPLKWGDIVEIPVADHPINVNWQGLPEMTRNLLAACLTRTVEVRVKDQSTNMVLRPATTGSSASPFTISGVLQGSGLLRTSSDLSRVKVLRHDKALGQAYDMQLDCSEGGGADLWVRDGDVIEVPERP